MHSDHKPSLSVQFEKPGRRENFDYPQMVKESVTKALADAKIDYTEVQQAVAAFVYGISRRRRDSLALF